MADFSKVRLIRIDGATAQVMLEFETSEDRAEFIHLVPSGHCFGQMRYNLEGPPFRVGWRIMDLAGTVLEVRVPLPVAAIADPLWEGIPALPARDRTESRSP